MLRAKQRLTFTAAMLTATWLSAVPMSNAHAQSQSPALPGQTQPGHTEPGQAQTVPDQKLDQAAAAIKKLATVREDYEQRINAAEPNDKERIAEEAKGALAKAITDQGLSLPEYTQILVIARNDPAVQDKIIQRLGTDK
jgi:uncharacterized protein DUF4168